MSEPTQHSLEVDGATLSYDLRDGDGPLVVVLHGVGSSRASEDSSGYLDWSPIARAGRRLVRYDARGHGRSTGRPEPGDYTWQHLAGDLIALVDHLSPDEPVDAVGVSMGVGTLLNAVTSCPERFRRLALVIPPTAWETRVPQGEVYRRMADLAQTQGRDAIVAAMASAPPLPLLAAGGWTTQPPDNAEELLPSVLRGAAEADFPASDAVAEIRQPVLLLPWIGDASHPVSTSERLHELLPESVMKVSETPEDVRAIGERVTTFFAN
jgi:pimeloyl-ACP methyl ester carboxylesterase